MSPVDDAHKTGQVTLEIVRKAIMGADIRKNRELYACYGGIPKECQDAVGMISSNYAEFEKLLWDQLSDLPFISRFFGRIIGVRSKQKGFLASPIVSAVFDDQRRLEKRLENVQSTAALQAILKEIGNITNPIELDRRLLDAWAEIRVIDQLLREGFDDVLKVETTADFVARCANRSYAIQVTRISREPRFPDLPTGDIQEIYSRVERPIGSYFWDSIEEKNLKFKEEFQSGYVRRIVIVTSTSRLQDSLNRHIACRQIKDSILALERRYVDEVQWLLDNGNGAIFDMETDGGRVKIRCLADWDESATLRRNECGTYYRREIDLDSRVPAYVGGRI